MAVAQFQGSYLKGRLIPGAAPGVDLYPDLGLPDNATQAQVTAAFENDLAHVPPSVLRTTSLDEEGFASVPGAYDAPQRWNAAGPADYLMQVRYFTAACQTFIHYHMAAIYYYEIPLTENPEAPSSFPPYFAGKPGAAAIRTCTEGQ